MIEIPGRETLKLVDLVLDFNGTIAQDGNLIPGIDERLNALQKTLAIHVATADTHGTAQEKLQHLPCLLEILTPDRQDEQKRDLVARLGADTTVAIGNGRNDALMLAKSTLGIAVSQLEGASVIAFSAADIVCTSILDALDLLLNPLRLTATLRN